MKLELNIPESWRDITLKQYIGLLEASTSIDTEDSITLLNHRVKQATILNPHLTEEQIKKISMSQMKEYFDKIDCIDAEPVTENCKKLVIDGKTYEFIEFKNMSLEQWIDSEKYSSIEECHKLIAIFYINPKDYSEMELDKVSNWLLDQPVTKTFWSVSFFLFIQKAFELALEDYSIRMAKQTKKIMRVIEISKKIDQKIKRVQKRLGFKSASM